MKAWKILTAVTLAIVAVALIAASAYAYMGRIAAPYGTYAGTTGAYGTYYSGGMMGGRGMMGGYGYYTVPPTGSNPQTTTPTQPGTPATTTPPYTYQYGGLGCHRGIGWNGNVPPASAGGTLNITAALTITQNYLTALGNPNLAVEEVEEYTQNFYVRIVEKDTGIGAFELLIDKYTGSIGPEMGPNMMWNTKYATANAGHMGGMMSGYTPYIGTPTATTTVTVAQAKANAQQFLNANVPGTTAGDATTFYGYYTIEVLSAGNTYGMLSVNGYTGQVWCHTWHGAFVQEVEL
jgi:hypothetical protein